jgi:hypothetical protein
MISFLLFSMSGINGASFYNLTIPGCLNTSANLSMVTDSLF